ncbi:hypothetical protein JCM14469_38410 [Desulfatiferula olefinivorans]
MEDSRQRLFGHGRNRGDTSPVSGERKACRLVQRMGISRYDKNVTILSDIPITVNQRI